MGLNMQYHWRELYQHAISHIPIHQIHTRGMVEWISYRMEDT